MSSLYKNNKTWYLSMSYKGRRITKSLRTKDRKVALELKPFYERNIIDELTGVNTSIQNLSLPELIKHFLSASHNWATATLKLNQHILNSYMSGRPLPINPTSRAIHIRVINQCWNYGIKHKLVLKTDKISGDIIGEPRQRTFTKRELELIFEHTKPQSFNCFVRFAYYTGARSGEIRSMLPENVQSDHIVVQGKTGRRMIKLNAQAQGILKGIDTLWDYNKDYVSHKFKQNMRKLCIKNARFHDIRRTFGLNLIKQGMSIYKVSKLLGHRSVKTTEQHYAPLLTVGIEDFIL